ncbi:MAG: arginine decarboxylase, pyruvoyl-dependent [Oscillospiraceae bacterium]|nr:arginine decarboxylase, pyruvoyl-dependent [Oscillospiraceae bacterium]
MTLLPKNFILRTSIGRNTHQLGAFDDALLKAGIGNYNLIKVSSILPPKCSPKNTITLAKGALLPSAYALIFSSDIGTTISAAVAVGIPVDTSSNGVIMEHSALGTKREAEEIVRTYVKQAMLSRNLAIKEIVSVATEVTVISNETYCAFATVSMW